MNMQPQMPAPNVADIGKFIYCLFDPTFVGSYPDAWVEIVCIKPDGAVRPRFFAAHDLKPIVDHVVRMNQHGFNCYVGAALRRGEYPEEGKRGTKAHFCAARYSWLDCDNAGDFERAAEIIKREQLQPAVMMQTGSVPHVRFQLYFQNREPLTDAKDVEDANRTLRDLFGGDDVQNCDRIMRIGGTINYPPKDKQARGYAVELTKVQVVRDAPTYGVEALCALAPAGASDRFAEYARQVGARGRDDDELMALLKASQVKGQWHNSMRAATASMVGKGWPKLAIRATCAPFAEGGVDDADVEKLIDGAIAKYGRPDREGETGSASEPVSIANQPRFLTLDDWRDRDLPMPDHLLGEIFSTTSRGIMSAPTGLGKTNFGIALGMRVAAGAPFLHWEGRRPAKVFYIDGEMSRRLLRQRLLAEEVRLLGEVSERVRDQYRPSGFHALSTEDIPNFHPLNTRQGQMAIERIIAEIGGCDFVIFDNVMSLISGSMVDEEAWAEALPWVKSLTKRSIGQLWVHHTGHDESKGYGTKTREWQMDVVIHLSKVERADTDVSFKLEFRKARERRPDNRDDFQPVNICLVNDRWHGDAASAAQQAKKVSPMAVKYLEALQNVVGSGEQPKSKRLHGCHAVHNDDWRGECELLGLLDPRGPKNTQRAKFSKYRAELVAGNMVACEGEHTWIR